MRTVLRIAEVPRGKAMSRIITLTGAKGSGKSSLFRGLQRQESVVLFNQAYFVQSPGRAAQLAGVPLGQGGSDDGHLHFCEHYVSVLNSGKVNPTIIADRCFVDHLAYVRMLSQNPNIIRLMETLASLVIPAYQIVFVCKLNSSTRSFKYDTETLEFREEIQRQIMTICDEYGASYQLLEGSEADFLEAALKYGESLDV